MTKFFNFFKLIPRPFWLSILSGLLIGTSYIPFSGWFLLICYAPLWIATLNLVDESNYKKIFLTGWITQFILTLIGFNWIYYVASEFGQLHWFLCAMALFLFSALMHLYIPFSLVIGVWIFKKFQVRSPFARLILLALVLSLLERIWPSIFEWNLAYTLLWIKIPLYHWADVVGFWGLSTWILLFQALITAALFTWRKNKEQSMITILSVLLVISTLSGLGLLKQKSWLKTDATVHLALAQGNIGNVDKIMAEKANRFHMAILDIYADLTEKHNLTHPETELMIWPETAMPFPLDLAFQQQEAAKKLLTLVKKWNYPLVTGAYSVDAHKKDHLGYPLTSNSIFYIGPNENLLADAYNKSDLLVFGEYLPFGEQLPFLYKLLPFVGVYKKGLGPTVVEIPLKNKTIKLGPQICYESLNPGFSRGLSQKNAEVLFNVTNDSWFGWWAEPFQHSTMTLARAIEVRRPLVRSTNTGISTVILASGTILESSKLNEAWAYTYEIPYLKNPPQTIYTEWGHFDWIFWILVMLSLIYFSKRKDQNVHD